MSKRLIIVSNRLPVTASLDARKVDLSRSAGGLASGLSSYIAQRREEAEGDTIWLGWPGCIVDESQEYLVESALANVNCIPVFYRPAEYHLFYVEFCNNTIWPLFHSLPAGARFNEEAWEQYKQINLKYLAAVAQVIRPGDIIWIHDFHLMLLPGLLREKFPDASIGFFLHTPFPTFEIFRILSSAWKQQILKGLLGADVVGMHTSDYVLDFLKCVLKTLGLSNQGGEISYGNRIVRIDSFPMGIDYAHFASLAEKAVTSKSTVSLRKGVPPEGKILLSVDRLDYSKGILNRLLGYEMFLRSHPEFRGKAALVLILVPSRLENEAFQKMKAQIDELIGRINGQFSVADWLPISYQYRMKSQQELVTYYCAADVALVTPFRDGMNLVAKEFVACRTDRSGVLVLSELAGCSHELSEAILVNPYHVEEVAKAINEALSMSVEEQVRRNLVNQERLKNYDLNTWATDFLGSVSRMRSINHFMTSGLVTQSTLEQVVSSFKKARKVLLLLDYDGTLVRFEKYPELASPPPGIVQLIDDLLTCEKVDLMLVTGRDRATLERWFKNDQIQYIAESGLWTKFKSGWLKFDNVDSDWMTDLIPVLEDYSRKLPGSFVERKEASVVWHYRNAPMELSTIRREQLRKEIRSYLEVHSLAFSSEVMSVDIRKQNLGKHIALLEYLKIHDYDFIASFGDDSSDEKVFGVLPAAAATFKVGVGPTVAKYTLEDYRGVAEILRSLVSCVKLPETQRTLSVKSIMPSL